MSPSNQHRAAWLAAISLIALATVPRAQVGTPEFDPLGEFNDLPKQIRVQLEFVEVSHEQLTKLMAGPRASANDGDLRKQVADLVTKGQAKVVETMMCVARSGQKATTESIEEYIYPTEYEPSELPNKISIGGDGEKIGVPAHEFATGPTPTAFETRNLGSTLEIEPTIGSDNRIIDLRLSPEIVYHVKNETWAEWNGQHGDASIRMPTMYSLKINTAVTIVSGEYHLIAALSPKSNTGFPDYTRKWMAFVKCDILTVGR